MDNNHSTSIAWTLPMLERFKKAHEAAKSRNAQTFLFDGHGFLVNYAAYLINCLEGRLA